MSAADEGLNLAGAGHANSTDGLNQIKVLIVDDHPGVRAGIRSLLHAADDMIVIDEGVDGHEAINLTQTRQPDIVLLDIELPGLRGDAVMRWIHESLPHIKVLAVTSYNDREYVRSMIENGASGYITKDEAPAVLVEAIRSIMRNGVSWFSAKAIRGQAEGFIEDQTLTQRELEILQHVILNRTPPEIAHLIGMEERRVQSYLDLLMRKFGVDTLAALQPIARRILSSRGI